MTDADCEGDRPVCDVESNVCVQCLSEGDCTEGLLCEENVCISPCELIVQQKTIRSEKLTKPRKAVLTITSTDELFDIFGLIDPGVFTWDKVKFNQKKNRLKITITVPAGLAQGAYPISVGDCSGDVVITGVTR